MSLQGHDPGRTWDGSCLSMGPGVHAKLNKTQCPAMTSKTCALWVPLAMENVYRKWLNPGIPKNRKREVFQTVNLSRTVWSHEVKLKGLLGGHLNIRSFLFKSVQMQLMLLDSNLDMLCFPETWLK